MDPIKDSIALHRICPIQQHTKNCVAGGCMAWVAASRSEHLNVEVDWPADIVKPRAPSRTEDPLMEVPTEPKAFGAWLRGRAEEALQKVVGGVYEGTGRTIVAATPVDFQLTKVRLTLGGEARGHCSLIR